MSTDLTSYILNSGLNVNELTKLVTEAVSSNLDTETTEEFQKVLDDATSKITEVNAENSRITETEELIAALDKSILGSVASNIDMSELSEDLLRSSGKENVVEELVQGHMQAIVTTKQDDDEDGFDIAETATGSMTLNNESEEDTHSVEESLEEIVERLSAIVAQV